MFQVFVSEDMGPKGKDMKVPPGEDNLSKRARIVPVFNFNPRCGAYKFVLRAPIEPNDFG